MINLREEMLIAYRDRVRAEVFELLPRYNERPFDVLELSLREELKRRQKRIPPVVDERSEGVDFSPLRVFVGMVDRCFRWS